MALAATHLESRAGPGLLRCEGWGRQRRPPAPAASSLVGLVGVCALPNTRPHSLPKINILYRHLAWLLCSLHRALCHWLGLLLFLERPYPVNPHRGPPVIFPLFQEFPQSFGSPFKDRLIFPVVHSFDLSRQSLL